MKKINKKGLEIKIPEGWEITMRRALDSIDLPEIEPQEGFANEIELLREESQQITKYMEFWELPPDMEENKPKTKDNAQS